MSKERSQLYRAQSIKAEKLVYVGNAWLKKYVWGFFLKNKYVGVERTVFGKWFQRNGAA